MTVYHCTFRGSTGAGASADIFSHSLGIQSNASAQVVATALRDAWVFLWTDGTNGLDQHFGSTTVYEEVTAAQVLDPMVPDLAAAIHVPFQPLLPGLGVAEPLPAQNAIAVSLTAGLRPNGTPFRGRFYLPAPTTTVLSPEGLLEGGVQSNIATNVGVMFSQLQAGGHTPSVWSRTVEDLVQAITQVRVGNKIDTIRRRRNAIPETYSTAAI